VTTGNIPYPHCRDSAILDIPSKKAIYCALHKARYSNYLERNEIITNFFSYSLKPPLSLPSQLRFSRVVPSCHLILPKCIDSFLAFPSLLIPSPIMFPNFIIPIGYFRQRTGIYIFPKMSRKFLRDIEPPIFNRLEASSRTFAEVSNEC